MTAFSNSFCPNARYLPYAAVFAWDVFFAAAMNDRNDIQIAFYAPGFKLQLGKKIWGWSKRNHRRPGGRNDNDGNGNGNGNGNDNDNGNDRLNLDLLQGREIELVPVRNNEWDIENTSPRERARAAMGIFRHMQGDNHDQNQFPNPNPNPNPDPDPNPNNDPNNNPNQTNGHRCNQIWVGNSRLGLYYVNGYGNLNLYGFGTAEKAQALDKK